VKVLIVDDERGIRESVARYLELGGWRCTTAENGMAGKEALQRDRFDVAAVDLRMPIVDGMELLRWINESGPQLPVVIISAFGEIADAVAAVKAGAADFVSKPFDPEDLRLRLERAAQTDSLRRAVGKSDAGTLVPAPASPVPPAPSPTMRFILETARRAKREYHSHYRRERHGERGPGAGDSRVVHPRRRSFCGHQCGRGAGSATGE